MGKHGVINGTKAADDNVNRTMTTRSLLIYVASDKILSVNMNNDTMT